MIAAVISIALGLVVALPGLAQSRGWRMVNRVWGEPASQLPERHDAGDFETKTGDKLKTGT